MAVAVAVLPCLFINILCATITCAAVWLSLALQTHPSDFQMLRGSVVVFTGIASYLFLGRRLLKHHLVGMVR